MHPLLTALLLALGLATAAAPAHAQACDDPQVLRFATIPKSDAERQAQTYRPLLRELERVLQKKVELARANSYAAVVEGLSGATIDLAELGPASYALAMQRNAQVTAFAALSAGGGDTSGAAGTYRSLLLVRKDSNIQSLKQLQGRTVSLTDPVSTSGALLPMQAVRQLTGQPLQEYFGRVTYAGSHNRAIDAVQKGLVSAAFVSSSRFRQYVEQVPPPAAELVALWQSDPIPSDPFVYRSSLCRPLVEKIRKVFFEGHGALRPFYDGVGNGRRFVPVTDNDYTFIREAIGTRPR